MKKILIIIVIILIAVVVFRNVKNKENTTPTITGMERETLEQREVISELEKGGYTLDTSVSDVSWKGSMGNIKSHTGTFAVQSGGLNVEDDRVIGGLNIDMNSVKSDSGGLDTHLKSADFFEVESFPISTFVITQLAGNNLTGDLTVKGITNEITLPVIISKTDNMVRLTGSFDFDRSKWDVRYGSSSFFDNLGNEAIDNIAPLSIDLSFIQN